MIFRWFFSKDLMVFAKSKRKFFRKFTESIGELKIENEEDNLHHPGASRPFWDGEVTV